MNPASFLIGLVLVGIGLTYLGINAGIFSPQIWAHIATFWPVLLIVLGLRFIFRNNALFFILTVAALIGSIVLASQSELVRTSDSVSRNNFSWHWGTGWTGESRDFQQQLTTDSDDTLQLEFGGRYNITVKGENRDSVSVDLHGPKEIIDNLSLTKRGNEVRLEQGSMLSFNIFPFISNEVTGTVILPATMLTKFNLSGAARVQAENLDGQHTIHSSGASEITFSNSTSINPEIDLSGASKVRLDHTQGKSGWHLSGASEILAESCDLDNVSIDTSGSSKVTITDGSIRTFTGKASGASKVSVPKPSGQSTQNASGAADIIFND